MNFFVLLAFPRLVASRTVLQQLLVCLNFSLDSEDLFCLCQVKSGLYELRQQDKQLKTLKMSEALPDTYDEGFIQQLQPEPTHRIH